MIQFSDLPLGDKIMAELGKLDIDFAFQPIFNRNGGIVCYEALMRPLGMNPLQLIELYKLKNGLHTLELATFFGATKAYYDKGFDVDISINSFPSECFSEEESAIYFQCFPDIAPRMFVEMLEYTSFNFDRWQLKKAQIMRNKGIRIALDDFGTGHSNMLDIELIHPRVVKFDRDYITDIHKNPRLQELYLYYMDCIHSRNIKVLAEGVEYRDDYEFLLNETDTDFFQGFYLGRPEL